MTTNTVAIDGALETQILTASGMPPLARMAFPGVTFNQPNNQTWLRIQHIPGATRLRSIEGRQVYNGIMQVDCYAPGNAGGYVAKTMADNLAAVFRPGLDRLSAGGFFVDIEYAELRRYEDDARWFVATVDIGWTARPPSP